ncbi:MAG: SH3 domain-containing protein [Parvularculaceae bacterium]|nr:hypothetical protein [Parvularculaceae bacterium]
MKLRAAAFALVFAYLSASGVTAQAGDIARRDTPSGFPVPRFVSLKNAETNCRIGPSLQHPVRFVFKRAGAPMLIVAESVDNWRKLRDSEGDECWAHKLTLKAQTHILAIDETRLLARPSPDAKLSGRIGPGVLARILKRREGWILVKAGAARGWVPASQVWGGKTPG